MTKTNKSLLVAILALILVVSSLTAYAVVLFSFRVKGNTPGNTDTVGSSVVSAELTQTTLDFTSAGQKIYAPLTVKSTAKTNVGYNFGLSVVSLDSSLTSDQLNRLASAILVYLDGNFCGTLASLTAKGEAKLNGGYLIGNGNEHSRAHTWRFELHIATETALLNKNIQVKIATYVTSADYTKYMFVSDEGEFMKAVDDINSGLGDGSVTQTIVLADNITLTQAVEFNYPVNIELNGNTLNLAANITLKGNGTSKLSSCVKLADSPAIGNGKIILNSKDAALDIADFTSQNGQNIGALYSANTQVDDYSVDLVGNLLKNRVSANLANGVQSGATIDMFGALNFYANIANVTLDGDCTYNNGKITANNITATSQTSVAVAVGTYNFTCGLRVVGGNNAATLSGILANELKHIPNTIVGDAVTYDVFLPKFIEGKNVRIEWASSDPDSISADGKLADVLKENTPVTLYATIHVNDSVYTTSFSFKVTSQTRETKFKYLVAQLSPIKLTKVFKGDNQSEAYYYLPIVGNVNDYREDFTMYGTGEGSIAWKKFKDIGLTELTYAVKSGYNFISYDGTSNAVYLNSATFYTFAQMTVTGKFGDDESYTENVNVIVELGSNSELYELVFSHVEKTMNDVDILQNLLDTRVKYGAKYEKGDFYLPTSYQGIDITCQPATTSGSGISSITKVNVGGEDKWHVAVDPAEFTSGESSQGIKITVKKEGDPTDGQQRILYVVAPAVIKPDSDGFANYSVFNSVKYQTVQQFVYTSDDKLSERIAKLPEVNVSDSDSALAVSQRTGFVKDTNGNTVTNTTADYILAVDVSRVSELSLYVGNDSGQSTSHDKAYKFAQLLAWATGDVKDATLPVAVTGYSVGGTTAVTSDGKKYMNASETAVLKAFLTQEVGFTEAECNSLWAKATTSPNGRVIDDYTEITRLAASMSVSASDKMTYFKYTELLQWALNEKDFPGAGGSSVYSPPNLGTIGLYNINMSGSGTNYTSTVLDWGSDPSNWAGNVVSYWANSKYNDGYYYVEDQTEYISDAEAQCIMAFWFGVEGYDNVNNTVKPFANNTNAKAFAKAFLQACIVPTYLDEDGAGVLVGAIYEKLRGEGNFTVAMTDNVPQISVLDFSVEGLTRYVGLTKLKICGCVYDNKVVLPAFITTASVNGCFNRVTKLDADRVDVKLTALTMKACTSGYTVLELGNLSRLSAVTSLDLSYNSGVTTVGDVLNVDIGKIDYLDVYKVNVTGKYLKYVLENIKVNRPKATIYYADDSNQRVAYEATSTSTSDELRFLKELTNVDSPYLLLANKVNVGNGDKTVQWYVNQGNPAYLVNDAGVDNFTEIATKEAMGRLMSNYYACTEDVTVTYNGTTYNLSKNNVYEISYEAQGTTSTGSFVFTSVGTFDSTVTNIPTVDEFDWGNASDNADYSELVDEYVETEPYYTDRTISNLHEIGTVKSLYIANAANPYIDFRATGSPNGWLGYVNALYEVTHTKEFVSKYRYYYYPRKHATATYNVNGMIASSEYSADADYFEYTITEIREYKLYFVLLGSSSTNTQATTGNLTQILEGSATNLGVNKSDVDFTDYTQFYYNGDTSKMYTYRENGHAVYEVTGYKSDFADNSFSGASLSDAQSLMESYLGNLSPTDDEYKNNVFSGEKTRVISILYTYTNPIAASSDITNAIDKATAAMDVNNRVLYKYTGATVTDYYDENGNSVSKKYTHNQGYRLTFAASGGTGQGGYSLDEYALQETANVVNMQAILTEANLHVNDGLFGNYYGNYYCYNGITRTIGNVTYTKGHVYRLLLKADRSGFYFEHDNLPDVKKKFTVYNDANSFMVALVNALNNSVDCLKEGAIVYYNGDKSTFYAKGLFELTRNEQTLTYYFKSMGGLGNQTLVNGTFLLNSIVGQNLSASGISKFTNIRYVGSTSSSYYSGTGGSEQVEVVARIVEGDTVYERYFLVTVSA